MEDMAFASILPEIVMLAGLVANLLTGLFLPRRRQWLVAVGAAVTLVGAIVATLVVSPAEQPVFAGTIAADRVHDFARIVILAGALAVVALAFDPVRGHAREAEFHVLVLFSALGATILAGATDLMLVVVAYLLSSVPLYTLTAFDKTPRSTEAAMKFLLMGALLGVTMLYGFAFLYGAGGATAYGELAAGLDPRLRGALIVGTVGALAGFAFKLGAVPAHFWVPDVTAGAPIAVAAYVTTIPKVAALVALARLVSLLPSEAANWPLAIALLATLSMTLGNLAAFWQETPRRLLAYSTIAQIGYLLMAVAVLGRSELALPGLLFYAAAYAAMNLGAFAVVAAVPQAERLDGYSGLARYHPAIAAALTLCLLSLIGIPPLGGFVGKLLVFAAAWDGGLAWLVVIGAINTVLSVFYYFRWIALMFGRATAPEASYRMQGAVPPLPKTVAIGAALLILLLGIGAQWILSSLDLVQLAGVTVAE